MPAPSPTDFVLPVEGVGSFTFAKRNMRNQLALDVEAQRLSEGVALDADLGIYVEALATLTVLTVQAPDGWSIEEMDPLDPDSYDKIIKVWRALRKQETVFREKPAP